MYSDIMLKCRHIADVVNAFIELTDETWSQANPFNTKPSQGSLCEITRPGPYREHPSLCLPDPGASAGDQTDFIFESSPKHAQCRSIAPEIEHAGQRALQLRRFRHVLDEMIEERDRVRGDA